MANTTGSVPEWLNETFLESCLKTGDLASHTVTVSSLNVQPVVNTRNRNSDHVFRANFKYNTDKEPDKKELSLIVKAPKGTKITEILEPMYKGAEFNFYNVFIPKVQALNKLKIVPKSYPSPKENVVVLEDMEQDGFEVMNNNEQLDFEHCKLYLETLAKMHAAGVRLKHDYPELHQATFPCARENLKNDDYAKEIVHAEFIGLKCFVKWIENNCVDDFKSYMDIINQINSKSKLRQGNLKSASQPHFKSFVQGYCSPTNVLFKHDKSGKPTDIRLIDFQVFNYDAVACDVINVIWTCANNEVQDERLEDLYKIYCNMLNSTLKQLKCEENLTCEQLKREIKENSYHTLVSIGTFLPLTLSEKEPDESIVFSGKSEVKDIESFYEGPNFSNKYPLILNNAGKQGVFEWLLKNPLQV